MNYRHKLRALRNNLRFDNWPLAVLQRLLFRHENLLVYRQGRVTFLTDVAGDDLSGTRECLTSDMYSRYYPRFPKTHPLRVLDLGANGGGFPLSLMAAGFSLAKCVCVEMNPNTHTRLQFNLNYNDRRHCLAVNAAVAGKSGWAELADTRGGTSESLYASVPPQAERIKVPLITFDEIVSTYFGEQPSEGLDVCKMDVEGAEYDVLHSGTCRWLSRVRFLIIEIHQRPNNDALALVAQITSRGFVETSDERGPENGVHCFQNIARS